MKTEKLDEALELLFEYHNLSKLREQASETLATVTVLSDKMNQSTSEAEKTQCQLDIVKNIERLILHSNHNCYNFKYNVLRYGLWVAITKLEVKLKELRDKIEEL